MTWRKTRAAEAAASRKERRDAWMREMWGGPCDEFEPGCPCCRAWAIYRERDRIPRPDDVVPLPNLSDPRQAALQLLAEANRELGLDY